MRQVLALVLLGLLASACSSRRACTPRGCAATPAAPIARGISERQFLVLRARSVGDDQVLVDASVVAVATRGPIPALQGASPVAGTPGPAWMGGTQAPDVVFGSDARLLNAPMVLALNGQTATLDVGAAPQDAALANGWHLAVTPTMGPDSIALLVEYRQHEGGRVTRSVPATTLSGPGGRGFILEALPVP